MDIAALRREIDEIDAEMIRLFEKRMNAAGKIGAQKAKTGCPVRDGAREEEILKKVRENLSPELRPYGEAFFSALMAQSRLYQENMIL